MIDDDYINDVRDMLRKITPGPWAPHFCGDDDDETARDVYVRLFDHPDSDKSRFYYVSPEGQDLIPALTGNGPTSATNATFIAAAPDIIRELVDEVTRLRGEAMRRLAQPTDVIPEEGES